MTRNSHPRSDMLAEEIRRQFGSPGALRYLNALPSLEVEPGLPARLQDLLGRLRNVEATRPAGRGRG
jgi:hypothetical protein